ncbi:heat shock 70 kDa protein 16 isoform X1 [Zea mays]|uniref:Heat shock 70 kDa protein 16 n=2 Tax=Zea mays TaxID=4577 RepID=A0A1D6GSM2_MAIZE|nr:heat shock 70 kDa protein 16 isoform X1 [Zea mays]AQK66029.1 Heat shock 70 kDa protein 16 [Zea mays]AQK66030.1 Heat shock 70 kDa protein 16 [Zea mays]AQK66031.1 Heat shock 70 kDa protein 16 [Zea mays]|eukprot:XP_008644888.1 heat shock 70 kDa protein 16 isoform X1 [Zea mays]
MSVVGFDVGNDTLVAAAARQRGIDVLLNAESKRESPAAIAFSRNARLIGCHAASASSAHAPFSSVKRLLMGATGRHPDSSLLRDLSRLPFPAAVGGGAVVHADHIGRRIALSPTHLLSMLLAYLKQLAEADLGGAPVADCVISVPCYFTQAQRRAYLDAAAIAGLRPLRLMHDLAATALGYGLYRSDLGGSGGPTCVAFVDVGQCDTQVAVVSFDMSGMKVLSHGFDADLGGRDFDEVLFEHFAEEFKDRYMIDVTGNVKASMRLRAACEKAKKVLSANAEAVVNIECLIEEKDVRGVIRREDFEKLCARLLERVVEPCNRAVTDSRIGLERLHSVELVGSGSRVPAIAKVLKEFFRKEPSRTLNSSECVARGCALQCAMLSPTFRVREYEVHDAIPASIGFYTSDGPVSTLSSDALFRRGLPFPSVKIITLQKNDSFSFDAYYVDANELPPGTSTDIGSFQIGPFQAHMEASKVKVKIRLNLHGLVSVESAALIDDYQRNATSADHMEVDTSGDDMGHKSRSERSIQRQELPITEYICCAMSKQELLEAQEQEHQLAYQDKLMERTKDRKNALESYVYDTRNKLSERYRSFATDSEREQISFNLQQTEDWLYEEGDDETEVVYSSKLEELKKLVDPIENRCNDDEVRAEIARELLKCIVDHRMAAKSLSAPERDAVDNECNKAEQWLSEGSKLQESLPKNVDPVLWSCEIKGKEEELDMFCRNITRHKGSPARTDGSRGSDHMPTPDRD